MPLAPTSPALNYTLCGPKDAPYVVFVNGLGGAQAAFSHQVRHFMAKHQVLTFDHRGMGGSEVIDGDTTMADYAHDLIQLLDHLQIQDAFFVGISFGGRVLQELAIGWPERVRALVLSGTSAGGRMHIGGPINLAETLKNATTLPVEEWAMEIGNALFGARYVQQYPNRIMALARWRKRHPSNPIGIACQWQAFAGFDASDRLAAITCPVLVAHGTDDRLSPMQNARWLVQNIPNCELVALEGIGHSPNIEDPPSYHAVIEDFLAGL